MPTTRIPARINPNKVWLIKCYPSGNYYINQEICGKTFYNGFVRTTKKFVAELLNRKENENVKA